MHLAICYHEGRSAHPSFPGMEQGAQRAIYRDCLVAALATGRRRGGPEVAPTLFTNVGDFGEPHGPLLAALGARIVPLDQAHAPPPALTRFQASFYLLDGVAWAAETLADEEPILFIDPDCLVTGPLDGARRSIVAAGVSAYRLWYPREMAANGLSRAELGRWLARRFGRRFAGEDPVWLGGEYLGLTGAGARRLAPLIGEVWSASLDEAGDGAPPLQTEEHVLSAAAALGGLPFHDAGRQFVRRIWTRGRYRNANNRMEELCVWHLPGEKAGAIREAFALVRDGPDGALDAFLNKRRFLRGRRANLTYAAYFFAVTVRAILAGRQPDFERDTH